MTTDDIPLLIEAIEKFKALSEDPLSRKIGRNVCDCHCSLCDKYLKVDEKFPKRVESCTGCPIHEHSGKHGCNGTPYEDLYIAIAAIHRARYYGSEEHANRAIEEAKDAAKREVEMLETILQSHLVEE